MSIIPYGNYQFFHAGNHNENDNPHPQYSIGFANIDGTGAGSGYTKIMTTYPIQNSYTPYLYLKGDLISYNATTSNTGELTLHIVGNTVKTFSLENSNNNALFSLYKRTIDANTYAFDLYIQAVQVNDQLKFAPKLCDFKPNKDWTAFQFPISQQGGNSYIWFLSRQPYASSISDTLVGSSSLKTLQPRTFGYVTNTITTGSTIDATNLATAMLNYSGATNVTGFTNYIEGQICTLHALNGNATLVHSGSSFALKGGVNVTLTTGQNVTMRRISTLWAEIGRNF